MNTTTTEAVTKLYQVTSFIDYWSHRKALYNNVEVTWFVHDRDYDPAFDYTTLLDRPLPPGEGYSYARGLVDESFTRHEADQLAEYLRESHGEQVNIAQVDLPIATQADDGATYIPVGAISVGGCCDFYMLSEHVDYNLPFKVWGYYNIEACPTTRPKSWTELSYAGDEPHQFAEEIRAEFGFDPSTDPRWGNYDPEWATSYNFRCPPGIVDAVRERMPAAF